METGNLVSAQRIVDKLLQSPIDKDPVWDYKLRVLKAQIIVSGAPDEAFRLLQPDPPAQLAPTDIPALRQLTLGKATYLKGDLTNAEMYVKDARRITPASSPQVLARIAFMQGYLARKQDPAAAEGYYREAARLAHDKEKRTETGALTNLGKILMEREQFDEAIEKLSAALSLSRATPVDPLVEQVALGNLGWSYFQLADFERAISLLKDADMKAGQAGELTYQAGWIVDLGDVYLSKKEYSQAEGYYLRGHSVATRAGDSLWDTFAIRDLALLELSRNNIPKAEEYNRQLAEVAKKVKDPYVHAVCVVTTAELAVRHGQLANAEKLLLGIIPEIKDSPLLRAAQSDLANVYVAEKKPAKADQEFMAAIRTLESSRARVKKEEHRMSILDAWPFYDDYIRFLINQGNARSALQTAEHSRSRTLTEGLETHSDKEPTQVSVPELSIPKIQNFLKSQGKIILAYWLADGESYLWVVTPTHMQLYRLPQEGEIEQEIQAYNDKILAHAGIGDSADGQKLYQILVRPAEKLVPAGSHVIIVPQGDLYKLNFETLVVPGRNPHYWIDDVTVETAGSMALLTDSHPRQSNNPPNLLLIGAPKQANSQFSVLNHADEEIQKVRSHFSAEQETVISKEAATPSSFKDNHPDRFTYIHFVTHGKANDITPLDSAIILSPQQENVFKLYARDIVGIKLNAEVVTIAACYGAGNKAYSGEGLVGLAWAFLRAGAHQVVAGLWEVDDQATPDLMDDFYTGLNKHQSAAVALRAAKLKMVHSEGVYRLPYYWASLQLYTGS